MAAFLYPIYTFATFGLAVGTIMLFQQRHEISIILLFLALAGMIYDNFIISIGNLIGEGSLLKLLNRLRFMFHVFTPILIVSVIKIISHAGVVWGHNSFFYYGAWVLVLGLIIYGLVRTFKQEEELIPVKIGGILRYKPQKPDLPIGTIITAVCCLVAGVLIWQETQLPWMFVGTLIMFCGNALPASILSFIIAPMIDMIFMIALLASDWIVLQG